MSSGVCGLVAAIVTLSFITLSALTLAPEQIAERDFGRYDFTAGFGTMTVAPGAMSAPTYLAERVGHDSLPTLSILGFPAGDGTSTAREGDWSREPLPKRYELSAGAWPTEVGEVAVAVGGDLSPPRLGSDITALSGILDLRVVGVVRDRYPEQQPTLLLPVGTYASLDPSVADAFEAMSAQPVIYWTGDASVSHAVERALTTYARDTATPLSGSFENSIEERRTVAAQAPQSWIETNPLGYTVLSLLLPLAAGVACVLLLGRGMSRRARQLTQLGVSPAAATVTLVVAVLVASLVSVVVGCLAGTAVAAASRPLLLLAYDDPLSPLASPVSPALRSAACLVAVLLLGPVAISKYGSRPRLKTAGRPAQRYSFSVGDSRHVGLAVLAAALLWRLPQTGSPQDAMWIVALCSLLAGLAAPSAIRICTRLLNERRLAPRLARRMLERDAVRVGATGGMLAMIVALAVGFTTLLTTLLVESGEADRPDVLEGQVVVADRASPVEPAPAATVDFVSRRLDSTAAEQVPLSFVRDEVGRRVRYAVMDGDSGYLVALPGVEEVERVLGRSLTGREGALITAGGVLDWREEFVDDVAVHDVKLTVSGQRDLSQAAGKGRGAVLAALRSERPDAEWASGKDGLMLTATVRRLGLPLAAGAVVFSPVTPRQAGALREAVGVAGIDPDTVQTYAAVDPPVPPVAIRGTSVCLFCLIVGFVFIESRARRLALTRYGAFLIALGLPPRWVRANFASQQVAVLVPSLLTGLGVGIASVALSTPFLGPQYDLSVPVGQTVSLVAATLLACGAALLLGAAGVGGTAEVGRVSGAVDTLRD